MLCPKCGKDVLDGSQFCPGCGAPIAGYPIPAKKFYQKSWFTWLLIIFLWPIGLILLWKNKLYSKRTSIIITAIVVVLAIVGMTRPSTPSSTTATTGGSVVTTQKSSAPTAKPAAPAKPKYISAGQYKIGKDLPAGEYVVLANNAYVELARDSSGDMGSILANDNIQNRTLVTVKDGQYFKVTNGKIYTAKDAPKVDTSKGILTAGMYKAGTDFPAGEYKVVSEGGDSYVEVASDSSHSMNSIISNDLFSGERYITVKAGQYLKLQSCNLKLK